MGIITFLSDFGACDWFTAAVKGEILKINPRATIVDITQNVLPHDIRRAAYILDACYRNFPKKTVHLAVVDPGVGSKRKRIIIEVDDHFFVGPDNGIFSLIARGKYKSYSVNIKLRSPTTFDAREVFGPVAAYLSMGVAPSTLGSKIKQILRFTLPRLKKIKGKIFGQVSYIDHFGNLITNVPVSRPVKSMFVRGRRINIRKHYGAVIRNQLSVIKGSHGYYEIACNQGNAAEILQAEIGAKIVAKEP